jgi:pimeloyl-ACP methyl ester carboxylesterase
MKKLGIVLVVFVATVVTIMSFVIPSGEKKVLKRLNELNIYPSTRFINFADSLKIKVTVVGDSTKPALLLIHGSPGDWSAWENIISNDSVRSMFYILAVDRAGYGGTTVPPLDNLREQAAVVWEVLSQMKIDSNITLAGHSYGGAVVEQLIIEHPENFNLGVLVAPTLSPDYMQPKWYNKVAKWSVIKLIISKDLKASNIEMLGLPASLKLNESLIPLIDIPLVYIQGNKDILVDPETVNYFSKLKPGGVQYVIIEDMNHFTPWSHPYLINDAILGKSKEKYSQ